MNNNMEGGMKFSTSRLTSRRDVAESAKSTGKKLDGYSKEYAMQYKIEGPRENVTDCTIILDCENGKIIRDALKQHTDKPINNFLEDLESHGDFFRENLKKELQKTEQGSKDQTEELIKSYVNRIRKSKDAYKKNKKQPQETYIEFEGDGIPCEYFERGLSDGEQWIDTVGATILGINLNSKKEKRTIKVRVDQHQIISNASLLKKYGLDTFKPKSLLKSVSRASTRLFNSKKTDGYDKAIAAAEAASKPDPEDLEKKGPYEVDINISKLCIGGKESEDDPKLCDKVWATLSDAQKEHDVNGDQNDKQ